MRAILLSAVALACGSAAAAMPMVGLTGERTLVLFDSAAPAAARTVEVRTETALAGIDLRPATGELVAVTTDGAILTVDPATGAVTGRVAVAGPMPAGQGPFVVDFNPAADKLRLMRGAANHRVDPDSGALTVDGPLAFVAEDTHAGETPAIVAAAYANSFGRPEKTAMYDIDAALGALIRQIRPNDGALQAVGKLGAPVAGPVAFDIATDATGTNTALLATGGALHRVDLETGAATKLADLTGPASRLRDIAAITAQPAP